MEIKKNWMTIPEAEESSENRISSETWRQQCRRFSDDPTMCVKESKDGGHERWVISRKMFDNVTEAKGDQNSKEKILDAALVLAEKTHYQKLSRGKLAESAGVSESTVQYHFRRPWELRYATLLHAIRRENLTVLGQGLGSRDPTALSAPTELRDRALKHIRDAAEAACVPVPSREVCEFAKRL